MDKFQLNVTGQSNNLSQKIMEGTHITTVNYKLPPRLSQHLKDKEKNIFTTVFLFQGVLLLFINSLTIAAIKKTNQHQKLSTKLILYYSISNLFIATVERTTSLLLVNIPVSNCFISNGLYSIVLFTIFLHLFMVLLINYDRYVHLQYLRDYAQRFTNRQLQQIVTIIFIITTAIVTVPMIYIPFQISDLILIVTFVIVSISVITLQIKTSLLLKRYRNQSRIVQSCINSQVLVMDQIYTFCFIFFHGPMVSNAVLTRLNVLPKRLSIVTMLSSTAILSKFEAIIGSLLFIRVNRPVRQLIQNSIMTMFNINQ